MHPINQRLESPAKHLEQWIKNLDGFAVFIIERKDKGIQVSSSVNEVDT